MIQYLRGQALTKTRGPPFFWLSEERTAKTVETAIPGPKIWACAGYHFPTMGFSGKLLTMVAPTHLRPPPSAERLRLLDPNLLQPLERLLLLANDPAAHRLEQMDAIREALPYTAETVAQRNERLRLEAEAARRADGDAAAALRFDFGNLTDAKAILRAERAVLAAVGNGALALEAGHRLIAMLDALRRAHADEITSERLLDYETMRAAPQAMEAQ
jgi:hypothetical protein